MPTPKKPQPQPQPQRSKADSRQPVRRHKVVSQTQEDLDRVTADLLQDPSRPHSRQIAASPRPRSHPLGQELDRVPQFQVPQANDLFPIVEINPNDLFTFRHSSVLRALVRDSHAEIYRLSRVRSTADEGQRRSDVIRGIEWVLGQLDSYYQVDGGRGEMEVDMVGDDEDENGDGQYID